MPVSAATAPTDRSMPPAISTIVMLTADTPMYALSTNRFRNVRTDVKPLPP